jgi:hypothetical protein
MLYGALKQALWFIDMFCLGQGLFYIYPVLRFGTKSDLSRFWKIELSRIEEMEFSKVL